MAELCKALRNVSSLTCLRDKYLSLGLERPRDHLEVKLVYSKQIRAQVGTVGTFPFATGPYRATGIAKHTEPAPSMRHIITPEGLTLSLRGDFPVKYFYCESLGRRD